VKQPGLIAATAIGVGILIGLGTWQFQRLQWKTDLLERIEIAATAAPLTSLRQADELLARGEPIDFRKIVLEVEPMEDSEMYRLFRRNGLQWERFVPVRIGRDELLVGWDIVEQDVMDVPRIKPQIYGHLRHYGDPDELRGGNLSVEGNRYYKFNQDYLWMGESEPRAQFYVDADPAITSVDAIPVRRPDLRNNHLQYMLTWWSFAVVLLIISTILYRRNLQEEAREST